MGQCGFTYNEEIYNHAALRPWLEAKGHCYQTRSATETILHLYEEGCQRPSSILTAPRRRVRHIRNLVAESHCRILR
jgi:hypothetical protein